MYAVESFVTGKADGVCIYRVYIDRYMSGGLRRVHDERYTSFSANFADFRDLDFARGYVGNMGADRKSGVLSNEFFKVRGNVSSCTENVKIDDSILFQFEHGTVDRVVFHIRNQNVTTGAHRALYHRIYGRRRVERKKDVFGRVKTEKARDFFAALVYFFGGGDGEAVTASARVAAIFFNTAKHLGGDLCGLRESRCGVVEVYQTGSPPPVR